MKINNISIEKFNDNKVKLNDQYEAEKKTEWEKDRQYVSLAVANKLAFWFLDLQITHGARNLQFQLPCQ